MNYRTITKTVIIAATILLIVYDVFAFCKGIDATISQVILGWSKNYPVIPFASGVLCGHLFWAQKESDE